MATGAEYVALAEALATVAHSGQSRKGSGEPYIEHPRRVAASATSWRTRCVAWLHDVTEDTPVTTGTLLKLFPAEVLEAVGHLTRAEGEKYSEYIDWLVAHGSRIALLVKAADLADNLRDVEDVLGKKHRVRYELALARIEEQLWADVVR